MENSNFDKNMLNTFNDLAMLDDSAIQKLMRKVNTQDLASALKSSSAELQDKIFSNMSERAAAMLKEDIDFMGDISIDKIQESQNVILAEAKKQRAPFLFSDILLLGNQAIQKVIKEIDPKVLSKALKYADTDLLDKIMRNMSALSASMLKEDLDFMCPGNMDVVLECQNTIVETIVRLEDSGEIDILYPDELDLLLKG